MSGILYGLWGAAAGFLAASLFYYWKKRLRWKRILQLTEYLETINCGKERALLHREDEFSKLEDELFKTVGEMRTAREEAQKERKRQAENLTDIAHQLKTPITSMSLMTQLMADGADSEQMDCLNRIDRQLARLLHLTSSLLTMSRLDADAIEFVRQPVSFVELMARASEPMDGLLEEKGQSLFVENGQVPVCCDVTWTAEALLNLIKNCSEHMNAGGVITARCQETPLYTQIVIEDQGCGFDVEEIPKLFRRFYKGKGSAKDSIGIGLALSRSIIEKQDGILRAENRHEGGAQFILRFYVS